MSLYLPSLLSVQLARCLYSLMHDVWALALPLVITEPHPPPDVGLEQNCHIAGNFCGRKFSHILRMDCDLHLTVVCSLTVNWYLWALRTFSLLLKTDQQSHTNRTLTIRLHLSQHLWFSNRVIWIGITLYLIRRYLYRSSKQKRVPAIRLPLLWFRFWSSWFINNRILTVK